LICLSRCFLDDNYSGPGVKSSGYATIPDFAFRQVTFPEAVNAFPLPNSQFHRRFPRIPSLIAAELITVRPRAFPDTPAAFPASALAPAIRLARLPSLGHTPSRG
jgi:hypothetical protein